jgi:hypothetical protein
MNPVPQPLAPCAATPAAVAGVATPTPAPATHEIVSLRRAGQPLPQRRAQPWARAWPARGPTEWPQVFGPDRVKWSRPR